MSNGFLIFELVFGLFGFVGGFFAGLVVLSQTLKSLLWLMLNFWVQLIEKLVVIIDLIYLIQILTDIIVTSSFNLLLQLSVFQFDLSLFVLTGLDGFLHLHAQLFHGSQLLLICPFEILHFLFWAVLDILCFSETFLCADVIFLEILAHVV